MYEVEKIIDSLISATAIIRSCKSELLNKGFKESEAEDIVKVYVYDALNKED